MAAATIGTLDTVTMQVVTESKREIMFFQVRMRVRAKYCAF